MGPPPTRRPEHQPLPAVLFTRRAVLRPWRTQDFVRHDYRAAAQSRLHLVPLHWHREKCLCQCGANRAALTFNEGVTHQAPTTIAATTTTTTPATTTARTALTSRTVHVYNIFRPTRHKLKRRANIWHHLPVPRLDITTPQIHGKSRTIARLRLHTNGSRILLLRT